MKNLREEILGMCKDKNEVFVVTFDQGEVEVWYVSELEFYPELEIIRSNYSSILGTTYLLDEYPEEAAQSIVTLNLLGSKEIRTFEGLTTEIRKEVEEVTINVLGVDIKGQFKELAYVRERMYEIAKENNDSVLDKVYPQGEYIAYKSFRVTIEYQGSDQSVIVGGSIEGDDFSVQYE